jgi:hypothetical protein
MFSRRAHSAGPCVGKKVRAPLGKFKSDRAIDREVLQRVSAAFERG